ncbi:MAG TPA: murein transglycosylase A [Leptolyngbyaceae cyanobacterium]
MMIKALAGLTLSLGIALGTFSPALSTIPLEIVDLEQSEDLGLDGQIWGMNGEKGDRQALLSAIDNSLRYLRSPKAVAAYRQYRVSGITRDRVIRSLTRFRQLVLSSDSPEELQAAVQREFVFYQAAGKDGEGTVGFTGYFEPTYQASRRQTAEYRYPLYRLPSNFASWQRPHPTRLELEGEDGKTIDRRLRGLELVWLRDRLEAFLVQIQGSARLQLTDGSEMTVGFAGKTDRPYTSIGRELVNDGKMLLEGLTLPAVMQYFKSAPEEMNLYLPRNPSFVFFRETGGTSAIGSLGLPVTAERSIATDKSLMPPGALALIRAQIPFPDQVGQLEQRLVSRYVLDQDTGGAIKGPGRVDIFMGTGTMAGDRAGLINSNGQLYYLLLKN